VIITSAVAPRIQAVSPVSIPGMGSSPPLCAGAVVEEAGFAGISPLLRARKTSN
jgi:hypothetical protein